MANIKIIINPAAAWGHGTEAAPTIERTLTELGVDFDLVCTTRPGEAIELARRASLDGYDVVAAAGGDGTAHEVTNGLLTAQPEGVAGTLALLPLGSGNDFAHMMGASEKDVVAACHRLVDGETRVVDVARLDDRYFVNGVGIGFDAMVSVQSRRVRFVAGIARYFIAVFQTILVYYKPLPVIIRYDGHTVTETVMMITIGNGRRHGGGFYVTPLAEADDGLLELCVTRETPRLNIFRLIPYYIKGTHLNLPIVTNTRARHIVVTSDDELPVHVDGEIYATAAHRLEMEIIPHRLRVLV